MGGDDRVRTPSLERRAGAGLAAGKTSEEIGGVELCERAFNLLVAAPIRAWCVYLLGLCPFGLILLYFLTDMTANPFAERHLVPFSFAVAVAVLWWRAWQARFAAELFAVLSRRPLPIGSALDWLFLGWRQIAVFAVFLVFALIAALVVVPTGWAIAFGQSASVIGGVRGLSLRRTFQEAAAEVFVWQRQNHVALLVLSAWTLFAFLNGYMLVFFIPELLKIATGVETVFTRSLLTVLMNSTVFIVVCFAVYAVVSPLAKAVYVLRHYYLRSRRSGLDIRDRLARLAEQSGQRDSALRLFGGALVAGMLFSLAPLTGQAQEPVTSEEIGEAIREVVQRPEFTWRMPAAEASEEGASLFGRWVQKVLRWAENFLEWIFESFDRGGGDSSKGWLGSFSPSVKPLLVVLLAVIGLLLAWLLCRLVLRRQKSSAKPDATPQVFVQPEVDDWTALANDLPEDEWLARARRFAEEGDYRRALRAFYLSALSHLHGKQLIHITRAKSNAAYLSEVKRREHQIPGVAEAFSFAVKGFDRVWYGRYEVDEAGLRAYEDRVSQIRRAAAG